LSEVRQGVKVYRLVVLPWNVGRGLADAGDRAATESAEVLG
jgi:hypothetical protein